MKLDDDVENEEIRVR